jgi:hypothetical protein
LRREVQRLQRLVLRYHQQEWVKGFDFVSNQI